MFIDFGEKGRGREECGEWEERKGEGKTEKGRRDRERERDRQTDRQTDIDHLPLIHALTRDQTCNLGTCPDWELNPQPFGVHDDALTN